MSMKNCQAIQKSCIDRKSNSWFTLGSESETMVCDPWDFFGSTAGQDFQITKMAGSPSLGNKNCEVILQILHNVKSILQYV